MFTFLMQTSVMKVCFQIAECSLFYKGTIVFCISLLFSRKMPKFASNL